MHKDWFEDDNEIRLLHRGKRRLLDIVFGRTMVITLLLVLQIAIMVLGAHYLGRYYPALTIVLRVMSVAVIIYLVNKSGSATTKITWIILVMALPAFGVLLYLFVQLDIGHRYANRRVQESILSTVQYVPRQTELMARLRTELPEVHNLAEYTLRSGDYPVYENTAVTYYPMGQDKIGALIEALRELSEEAYSEVGGADAIIAEAERRIFSIAENKFDLSFDRIRDVLRDNLSLLEQLSENPDLLSGVKTQFEGLDRVLVGLGKGDLVLVGARPGMGKTSFVMNIAANFAKATKEKVAVFSLEMSSEQLVNRMLASEALIDNNALRTGKMSTEEWKRIAAAASLLSETQIYIDDTPGINVNMMKAKLRRLKDVKLVIIDYLQLMQSERHTDNRVQEVAEMTRALKLLAKEFACPIILCSQLSRSNEARSDKRPMLSDLRDSGAIEQDADIVIFLYRNDYYSKEEDAASGEAIVAECLVAKNRHGPTGTVNLIWQGKNFRFYTPEEKYDHVG